MHLLVCNCIGRLSDYEQLLAVLINKMNSRIFGLLMRHKNLKPCSLNFGFFKQKGISMRLVRPFTQLISFSIGITSLYSHIVLAQTTEAEALSKLSFVVGDWLGVSSSYKNGEIIKSIPVREKVTYQLEGNLINIVVSSPALKLQTIVRYSVDDGKYYYHPFTKNSTGEYEGYLEGEKFIVKISQTYRLTFERTDTGFREFGTKLVKGEWVKNFQDDLYDIKTTKIDYSN